MPINSRKKDLQKPKVLHVDDNDDSLDLFRLTFSGHFDVKSIDDSTTVMVLLEKEYFDVIITDYEMPEIDGLKLLKSVKETHPGLPVIFYTGQGNESIAREAFISGVSDYFTKDVFGFLHKEKVINAVKKAIEIRESLHDKKTTEKKYEEMANLLPQTIFEINADGDFYYFNQKATETIGFTHKDFKKGINLFTLIDSENPEKIREDFNLTFDTDENRSYVCRVKRKDGSVFPATIYARLISRNNRKEGYRGILVDRSEIKEIRQALAKSEERFKAVADYTYDWESWFDPDGRVLWINPAVERLFGFTVDECLAMDNYPAELFYWEDRENACNLISDAIKNRSSANDISFRIICKDKSTLWIALSWQPIYGNKGEFLGLRTSGRNITKRKKSEEALKTIAMESRVTSDQLFFQNISLQISGVLNADYVYIGEIVNSKEPTIRTLAASRAGKLLDNFEFRLKDTPCSLVMDNKVCSFISGVKDHFPNGMPQKHFKVEGYSGINLLDRSGKPIGIIAALFSSPLEDVEFAESMLRIFASRTSVELERSIANRKLEHKLKKYYSSLPGKIGNWQWDIENDVFVWSDQLFEIFGVEKAEVEVTPTFFLNFIVPEDLTYIQALLKKVLREGNEFSDYFEIVRPDGERRRLLDKGEVIRDHTGKAVMMLGMIQDVTDQLADDELMEEQRLIRSIIESLEEVYWISSLDFSTYYYISPGYSKIWDVEYKTPEESLTVCRNSIHPDDSEWLNEYRQNVISLLVLNKLEHGKGIRSPQYRIISQTGEVKWLQTTLIPIYDQKGFGRVAGLTRDITKDVKTLERYKSVVDITTDLIYEWDVKTEDFKWFGDVQRTLGCKKEEAPQKLIDLLNLVHTDDRQSVMDSFVNRAVSKTPVIEEYRFIKKDGSIVNLLDRAQCKTDREGRPVKWIGSCTDVSIRKKLEKMLLEKNRELNDFAQRVSHELKNPINIIRGYATLLKDSPVPDVKYLDRILNATNRFAAMIDRLLSLSRAGRTISKKEEVNTEFLIRKSFEMSKRDGVNAVLEFLTFLPDLYGDSEALEELFTNLIQNSIKYCDPEKSSIIMSVSSEVKDNFTTLFLKDNGIGLDETLLEKVFDPGFVLAKDKGTGFGLAIARKIADAHGGNVEIKSKGEGLGVTYIITLPNGSPG